MLKIKTIAKIYYEICQGREHKSYQKEWIPTILNGLVTLERSACTYDYKNKFSALINGIPETCRV